MILNFIGLLTLKVHFSFSSGSPEAVISVARTNSLKSIDPLLSRSKIRKRCSIITVGSSSFGKIRRYMSNKSSFRKTPSGHSFRNLLYQSLKEIQIHNYTCQVKLVFLMQLCCFLCFQHLNNVQITMLSSCNSGFFSYCQMAPH